MPASLIVVAAQSTLHVSTDQGTTFNAAHFPSPGKTTDYAIVPSPENDQEAFVVVQHSVTAFVGGFSATCALG